MARVTDSLPEERKVIGRLSRARDLTQGFLIEALAARGLGELVPSHGEILMALYMNPAMTMQDIAKYVARTKPTVTVLVDKLLALGYVSKKRSPDDGRIFQVSLTAKGKRLLMELGEISEAIHSKIDNILSTNEKQQLNKLLAKLVDQW
ncbi:MarR family winged helix-turn-helix transcriptional regulator [Maricurvus nonylphenolicus]|uniref:MarR family winged helix-turn-helix transcriptional regulator n=1 Tax=Maricurvus nonylphenolicus TaxID=1008307 RepID=UPI0036F44C51